MAPCATYLVIDREMKTFGTIKDLRVLLTCLSDCWRVDQRSTDHQYSQSGSNSQSTDIIGKSSKEQVWVLPPDPLEVYMLQ
jgi:hypothetical protein